MLWVAVPEAMPLWGHIRTQDTVTPAAEAHPATPLALAHLLSTQNQSSDLVSQVYRLPPRSLSWH